MLESGQRLHMGEYLKHFTNHLEFLGYKTEILPKSKADDPALAIAKHSRLNNLLLATAPDSSILHIQVRLSFNRHVSMPMYEYLEEANGAMNVSRAYINEEKSELVLQTHYTGSYDKATFGAFLNLFDTDQQILVSLRDFETIWT